MGAKNLHDDRLTPDRLTQPERVFAMPNTRFAVRSPKCLYGEQRVSLSHDARSFRPSVIQPVGPNDHDPRAVSLLGKGETCTVDGKISAWLVHGCCTVGLSD